MNIEHFVSPDNDIHLKNYLKGKYLPELKYYEAILSKYDDPIFFDIGANIGYYSYCLSNICKKIYSFEPVNDVFVCLKENLKDKKNIDLYKVGISNEIKQQEMMISEAHCQGSSFDIRIQKQFNHIFNNKKEIIDLITLENFIEENNIKEIDLIKLDIEGAELKAILGLGDKIKYVKNIVFETYFVQDLKLIEKFSKNYNFKLSRTSLTQAMYILEKNNE